MRLIKDIITIKIKSDVTVKELKTVLYDLGPEANDCIIEQETIPETIYYPYQQAEPFDMNNWNTTCSTGEDK